MLQPILLRLIINLRGPPSAVEANGFTPATMWRKILVLAGGDSWARDLFFLFICLKHSSYRVHQAPEVPVEWAQEVLPRQRLAGPGLSPPEAHQEGGSQVWGQEWEPRLPEVLSLSPSAAPRGWLTLCNLLDFSENQLPYHTVRAICSCLGGFL